MKKLFIFAAAVLFSGAMQARNWRINNLPEAKADFLSIYAAMASADVVDGDILYLDPGCHLPYQTITKGVTIIGNGFNLRSNEMESSVVSISVESKNVVLRGVHINEECSVSSSSTGFVIERCKVGRLKCKGPFAHIASCYITGSVWTDNAFPSLRLYNNIILGTVSGISYGIIKNNVIVCDPGSGNYANYRCVYDVSNSTIIDNIILNTNVSEVYRQQTIYLSDNYSSGNDIKGNILSNDADHVYADHPSNSYIGATVADVFVNEGMYDELYRLKEDSPAKGAGYGGNDCGPFAGMYPYVMSCRPKNIPYIYEAIVPNHPTDNKITLTVKAKNQDE